MPPPFHLYYVFACLFVCVCVCVCGGLVCVCVHVCVPLLTHFVLVTHLISQTVDTECKRDTYWHMIGSEQCVFAPVNYCLCFSVPCSQIWWDCSRGFNCLIDLTLCHGSSDWFQYDLVFWMVYCNPAAVLYLLKNCIYSNNDMESALKEASIKCNISAI